MDIKSDEIVDIEETGILDKNPVKMIRTKGGFWIAIGKPKGKHKEEALAAGSHPAIVKYNLEKQYPNFEPSLMKSEIFSNSCVVEKHSHFLSENLRKSGHDIFSVKDGNSIEFYITKQNSNVAIVKSTMSSDSLVINELKIPKEFVKAIAGAATEKALSCDMKKIRIEK